MAKQATWYVWDSRGGLRGRPDHCQIVNFDLEVNQDEWLKQTRGTVKIEGSIESGRMTYRYGSTRIEFWREDQPNPTPYKEFDNPDPIDDKDPARIRITA